MPDMPMGSSGTLSFPGSKVNTGNEASFPTSTISVKTPNVGANSNDELDKDKREIERLRSTSPLYDKYRPLWDFFLAAYEGGKDFASTENIFRHPREHPDDFQGRAKRLYYHNYCYPLVDFYTTFIFTETIQRTADKDSPSSQEEYSQFLSNVNNKGDDITEFMMQVCDDMQIFGMSYILVDAPERPQVSPGQKVTKAQQDEAGIKPYWVLVKPTEVLDWVTDSFDKFTYLKRVEYSVRVSSSMVKQNIERYTEWTPNNIKVSEVDVTNPDQAFLLPGSKTIDNESNKIPFQVVRYKRSKIDKFMGLSFLNDIAFIGREVMNLTSLLQEFLYRQCFVILAVEADPNVPEIEQMQGEVSTANVWKYATGTKEPKYVAPPVSPAEFIQKERTENILTMYKIAAQDTKSDLFNGGKASGFSKSQDFQTTVPKIATRAETLEAAEMALMELTYEFKGQVWKGAVKYKDHYQITNLSDALNQLQTLFKNIQITSKTFAEMQMKRMIDEFDGKLTPEQRQKVYKEIEDIDWDQWFDVQKLAFIGVAARSPEAGYTMSESDANAAARVDTAKTQSEVDKNEAEAGKGKAVKGKDTPTAASTPKRATSSAAEIKKESRSK